MHPAAAPLLPQEQIELDRNLPEPDATLCERVYKATVFATCGLSSFAGCLFGGAKGALVCGGMGTLITNNVVCCVYALCYLPTCLKKTGECFSHTFCLQQEES